MGRSTRCTTDTSVETTGALTAACSTSAVDIVQVCCVIELCMMLLLLMVARTVGGLDKGT